MSAFFRTLYFVSLLTFMFYFTVNNSADSKPIKSTSFYLYENCYRFNIKNPKILFAMMRAEIEKCWLAADRNELIIRYERHLRYGPDATWYLRMIKGSPYINSKLAYCSFGKLQVLYGVAYSVGFRGRPEDLNKDEVCFYYACKHYADISKVYHNVYNQISVYNAGHLSYDKYGRYNNYAYVNKVIREI